MKYNQIVSAVFLERPNRFIAYVELMGKKETVHVKNTGRCRELLTPGVKVYLETGDNPNRKTAYDLVAVQKGDKLINMDSQAPNKAVEEWLRKETFFQGVTLLRPEKKYKNSRFDFYFEFKNESGVLEKAFMEVKGVTLEENGVVSFPDAPSERAVKHVQELMEAKRDGYQVYIMFVIQMKGITYFTPNVNTQPEFAEVLRKAGEAGVRILAYDCVVTPEGMTIDSPVPVRTGSLQEICEPLLNWYDKKKRSLPWREDPQPYKVWVSEIMLQQTRVEAAKLYFERFIKELPGISELAEAKEERLLKLWEGLGYYNRVRNMQKAAKRIVEEYQGQMPDSYEEIVKLPGIGSYTAGAIASFAFGKAEPAVDGNVLRVLSRLKMEKEDVLSQSVKKRMENLVRGIIPQNRPGDFNQALIELGALVCLPNGAPRCEECPVNEYCLAHQKGNEQEYPYKAPKKARRIEKKTVLLFMDGNQVALNKRPAKGLLAGMYEFPMLAGDADYDAVTAFCKECGLKPLRIVALEDAKHVFSHVEWHMKGYAVRVDELHGTKEAPWIFVEPKEAGEQYPIPSAFAAYTRYLHILQGSDKFIEVK